MGLKERLLKLEMAKEQQAQEWGKARFRALCDILSGLRREDAQKIAIEIIDAQTAKIPTLSPPTVQALRQARDVADRWKGEKQWA